jgi:thiamine pyrophosphate-dependent acetolactate synthase large subunit-like protein
MLYVGQHFTYLNPAFREKASARKENCLKKKQERWEKERSGYDALRSKMPMDPSEMMQIVVEMLPENAIIYDESITSSAPLVHYMQSSQFGL